MLKYEPEAGEVQLVTDRGYREGDPITVWFGPQPNQRAFLNYGIVDEDNPHDKLMLEASHSSSQDTQIPLFSSWCCSVCS